MRFGRLRLLVIMALALLASACGIETDETPAPLAEDALPVELRPGRLPTAVPVAAEFNFQIYMVGDDSRLTTVGRNIALDAQSQTVDAIEANAEAIIRELLLGTTRDEEARGIDTAIPRATDLVSVVFDPDERTALVTLTPGSLALVVGDEQRIALGQIVYSLTTRGTIDGVSFAIGEEALPIQADSGLTERGAAVGRADFASLDRNRAPAIQLGNPEDSEPIPTAPTVDTETSEPALIPVEVWMIGRDELLVPVARTLERTPAAMLSSLSAGLSATERAGGLRTALTVQPLSVEVDQIDDSNTFRTAFVDFAAGSLPEVTSPDRLLAAAQIVFTLTGLIEIEEVVISVDGVITPMPTDLGLSEEYIPGQAGGLVRADYAQLATPDA